MIVDFFTAGTTPRTRAAAMYQSAHSSMNEVRDRCRAEEEDTRQLLGELDAQRRQAADELVMAYPLYRLAGLSNPGLPAEGDAVRLPIQVFNETSLPGLPSALAWMAGGALGGAISGGALILAAGLSGPAALAAGIIGGAVAGTMVSGLVHGRKALAVAREHLALAQQWRNTADAHVLLLERIRRSAKLSTQLTLNRGVQIRSRQAELEDIALDTTNAAKLLKDVLNTALLNEDGAFLEEVIEQLHGQEKRIASFAGQIAAA